MKIINLEVQNVKRVRAVSIAPGSAAVVIGGMNGQGKSSVIDAIEYALAGKRALPERPIRDGEDRAEIVCELDGMTVRRVITETGSTLVITDGNGARLASPQAILDRMVGTISFDPLDFVRLAPKEQVRVLEGVLGVNVSALDAERAALYDRRTEVNREAKRLEAVAATEPPPVDPALVAGDVSTLADELQDAVNARNAALDTMRERTGAENRVKALTDGHTAAAALVCRLQRELEMALAAVEEAEAAVLAENDRANTAYRDAERARAAYDAVRPVEAIKEEMAGVAERQRHAAAQQTTRAQWERTVAARDLTRADAEALTASIAALDTRRAGLVAGAIAGIQLAGLDIGDSGVTWHGVPLAQCSSAEQLRVGVGVGLAANPQIRVVLIREGALLDDSSLGIVAGMAAAADAQVWIERVGEGAECSVIIEDGAVKVTP